VNVELDFAQLNALVDQLSTEEAAELARKQSEE
jgi:hypothetical protein